LFSSTMALLINSPTVQASQFVAAPGSSGSVQEALTDSSGSGQEAP